MVFFHYIISFTRLTISLFSLRVSLFQSFRSVVKRSLGQLLSLKAVFTPSLNAISMSGSLYSAYFFPHLGIEATNCLARSSNSSGSSCFILIQFSFIGEEQVTGLTFPPNCCMTAVEISTEETAIFSFSYVFVSLNLFLHIIRVIVGKGGVICHISKYKRVRHTRTGN